MSVSASGRYGAADIVTAAECEAHLLHDIRSPLSVVIGQAQLLLRRPVSGRPSLQDPGNLHGRLDRIVRAATQIADMLDELQELSRRDGFSPPPPRLRRFDLVELVRRVAHDYSTRGLGHHVAVLAAAEPLLGDWDENLLGRALGNLIGNAIKYGPDASEVRVILYREHRTEGDRAIVVVRDFGIGIPAADLPHIFDPFYRAGNVTRNSRATDSASRAWRTPWSNTAGPYGSRATRGAAAPSRCAYQV